MKHGHYTAAEDALIIARYAVETLTAIAAALDRPILNLQKHASVLQRHGRLDVQQRCYNRAWTADEDDYLLGFWGLQTDAQVTARLGRSVESCETRARSMGITRKANFYTANAVSELFGVDVHAVTRWIVSGCLHATRSAVGQPGRQCWCVRAEDIEAFIKAYPYHYNRKQVERDTYYRLLAERVWAADPWLTSVEAAALKGVAKDTVLRHLRGGRLQGVKTWECGHEGGWRIARSALARWQPQHAWQRRAAVEVTCAG